MKAVVLTEPNVLHVEEVSRPVPANHELLIRRSTVSYTTVELATQLTL